MRYKHARKPLPEIAAELHVDGVVEGSVQRSGDQVRISAQLIQAATDTHLWAESYEGDMHNVLALEDDMARAIASKIRIEVTPQEQARLATSRQVNPAAHELYLKGRYFWNRRTREGFKKALEYFGAAIAKDPNYAPAYAGIASTYVLMGHGLFSILDPREAY